MSYHFTVTKADGQLTVAGSADLVPDGTFEIGGHEDDSYRSVGITRKDPGETTVKVQATGFGGRQ